jgi:K+/H+ antiporter YhaU regulatory subunit KhtT
MVMNVPSVTDFDRDPAEVIETGDHVIVYGDEGVVEVIKKTL